jgi:hypothetical protein
VTELSSQLSEAEARAEQLQQQLDTAEALHARENKVSARDPVENVRTSTSLLFRYRLQVF